MANFNSNFWYQIYANDDKDFSLWGSWLYDSNRTGAAFMNTTDTSDPRNRWQIYPVNSSAYVLRSQRGGPEAFLAAGFVSEESTPGQTRAIMINGTSSDQSVYWTISPWGDGTFFMANGQNGTDWHLQMNSDRLLSMSSNITDTPPGQRWSFTAKQNDRIQNQPRFSSVDLPSSTIASAATISSTAGSATGTSNGSPGNGGNENNEGGNDSSSSGLSTGAKAGIGVAVGVIALLGLVLLGLWLYKRKQKKNRMPPELAPAPYQQEQHPVHQELPQRQETVKYEMQHEPIQHEMPSEQKPLAELPSETVRR